MDARISLSYMKKSEDEEQLTLLGFQCLTSTTSTHMLPLKL